MIIDAHSHLGNFKEIWSSQLADAFLQQFGKFPKWWGDRTPWKKEDFVGDFSLGSVDDYVRSLDDLGIDKAVVFGQACAPFSCRTSPDVIASAVARHPDRLIGLHASDPVGYPDAAAELERAVTTLGLKGVKVYPGYNNATPNDARLFPLYQKAAELGVPVYVHTGYTVTHSGPNSYGPLMKQYPLYLEEVAATFPTLRIVMAHFANPWAEDAIQLMRKYEYVYADTAYGAFPFSWKVNALVWAKNFGVLDKVLFGSDYPLHSPGLSIETHRRMPAYTRQHGIEPELTEDDIDRVLGMNAARMLGLA